MAKRVVTLISGATSASGYAVASSLVGLGHDVVATSRNESKLADLAERVPGVSVYRADLAQTRDVETLADALSADEITVGSLVHLVGGWRGGDGIADQTDDDWEFLLTSFTALRKVSRQFVGDIRTSGGRVIAVSSPAATKPRAGAANYAAMKAATDAWTLAIADEFTETDAAASVIVVVSLAGKEGDLADRVAEIMTADAASVNGKRFPVREPIA